MKGESKFNGSTKVKTIILCDFVYPYHNFSVGFEQHTCVGVFDQLAFFDFPSLPRNFEVFAKIEALKGSYKMGMNIVHGNGYTLFTGKVQEVDVEKDNTIVDYINSFQGVIFPYVGEYCIQLIVDNNVIYTYKFNAIKIERREYTSEELEERLEDPDTIKATIAELQCSCGRAKKFSLTLDPKKQRPEEKLPEGDKFTCECGIEHDITELKAQMKIFLGSKNLVDTFNRNLNESRSLAANGFLNSALIMQVSAFEAFMRDKFVLNFKNWFMHLLHNKNEFKKDIKKIKEKMIKLLNQMKIKDQFYDQLFLTGHESFKSELEEVYHNNTTFKKILFGDEEESSLTKVISFQQLRGTFGCFWAYKHFLEFDLSKELKKKDNYYDALLKFFGIRHRIVHGSSKQTLIRELDVEGLKKNEKIILFIRDFIQDEFKKLDEKRKKIEEDV